MNLIQKYVWVFVLILLSSNFVYAATDLVDIQAEKQVIRQKAIRKELTKIEQELKKSSTGTPSSNNQTAPNSYTMPLDVAVAHIVEEAKEPLPIKKLEDPVAVKKSEEAKKK